MMNNNEKLVVMHLVVNEVVLNRILVHARNVKYFNEFGYQILEEDPHVGRLYKGK